MRAWGLRSTAVALGALAPLALSEYWRYVVTLGAVYAMAAASLVVLTGWTGQVSLAQASFMGISAYLSVALPHHFGVPFFLAAPVAVAATVPFTLLVGFVARCLSGFYLAASSVAFALAVQRFLFQVSWLTGGNESFPVPRLRIGPWDVGSGRALYCLVAGTGALVTVILTRLRSARTGRAWASLARSERAARSFGVDVGRYKLAAFWVAGIFASVSGMLYALYNHFISPSDVGFTLSGEAVLMVLIGGEGTLIGSLIGTTAYLLIQNALSSLTPRWQLVLGALFVVFVLFVRRGFVGMWLRFRSR
jgi:branched-chain amino acid transport system permease protein